MNEDVKRDFQICASRRVRILNNYTNLGISIDSVKEAFYVLELGTALGRIEIFCKKSISRIQVILS